MAACTHSEATNHKSPPSQNPQDHSRYHHCQIPLSEPLGTLTAPDNVTLREPFRFCILTPSIHRSPTSVPYQRPCPFCVLPCLSNTKAEQPGTLRSHGVASGNRKLKMMDTTMYSKPFPLPRLVEQAWVSSTLFFKNFYHGQRI